MFRHSQSPDEDLQSVLHFMASPNVGMREEIRPVYHSCLNTGRRKETGGLKYPHHLCTCFQRNLPHGLKSFENRLRRVVPG